jgi:thiol:disulfide interchange protein DsbA
MKQLITLAGYFLFLFFNSAYAADEYLIISPSQPIQNPGKIEVVEVFWYGCPHCYDIEPYLDKWLETKADDVDFIRMPGIFRKSWIPHAKAFYAAEKMGVLDKFHQPLFHELHKKRKKVFEKDSIIEFAGNLGIDEDEFEKAYESDEVEAKVKQAFLMGQRYKVPGTPAMIVNGKYLVSGSTAGNFGNAFKVINQLVDKERALTAK